MKTPEGHEAHGKQSPQPPQGGPLCRCSGARRLFRIDYELLGQT